MAVLVALFQKRFWDWVDRPRLSVDFDRSSERCFRWATVSQDDGTQQKRWYFRPRIHNQGGAVKNVRIRAEVLDENKKPVKRFEPSTLNWITGSESMDLAKEESEYINLISQLVSHPYNPNRITVEVSNTSPRGITWDRELNTYFFEVTLYADNIKKPVQITFKFTPNPDSEEPGTLTIV